MLKAISLLVASLFITLSFQVYAHTIVFQNGLDGYSYAEDTHLGNSGGARVMNDGQDQYQRVGDTTTTGNFNLLYRWNLTSLAGTTINGATVHLQNRGTGYSNPMDGCDVHKVLPTNADWIQGGQNTWGAHYAEIGEPCWNLKIVTSIDTSNPDPEAARTGVAWAGSPGCETAGLDYDASILSNFQVPDNSNLATRNNIFFELPAGLLQDWADNPDNNAGILVKMHNGASDATYVRFYSNECVQSEDWRRPKLIVNYTTGSPENTIIDVTNYGANGNDDIDIGEINENLNIIPDDSNSYKSEVSIPERDVVDDLGIEFDVDNGDIIDNNLNEDIESDI